MEQISNDIIARAAQGDARAFEEIYRAYCGFVYAVALRTIGDPLEAEEVTQDVFISMHRYLKDFEYRSTLKTWLFRITVNSAINAGRKRSRERNRRVDWEAVSATFEVPAKNREALEREDREKIVQDLLGKLSAEHRMCVVLREIEGLSYQEIAEALQVKINTVRTRLKRARESLMACRKKEVVTHGV